MNRTSRLSRRTVLRGLGTAIALPCLEAMMPAVSRARELSADNGGVSPRRMAFLYVPNGVHMADWTPAEIGSGFSMPPTLKSLQGFKDDLLVLTGLAQHNAEALGDGPGDHARSLASFLTGAHRAQDRWRRNSSRYFGRSGRRREGGKANPASLARIRHRTRGSVGEL